MPFRHDGHLRPELTPRIVWRPFSGAHDAFSDQRRRCPARFRAGEPVKHRMPSQIKPQNLDSTIDNTLYQHYTSVALGVPLYACGGGSIPVIDSMMQMGMTRGAALAFFISGPATKFSTLSVFGTVFGSRLLGLYLAVMLVGALIWGWVYPFSGGPLLPNWN